MVEAGEGDGDRNVGGQGMNSRFDDGLTDDEDNDEEDDTE